MSKEGIRLQNDPPTRGLSPSAAKINNRNNRDNDDDRNNGPSGVMVVANY